VPSDGVTILDLRDRKIQAARTYFDSSIYLPFLKAR
jgi:hypothetical protein